MGRMEGISAGSLLASNSGIVASRFAREIRCQPLGRFYLAGQMGALAAKRQDFICVPHLFIVVESGA